VISQRAATPNFQPLIQVLLGLGEFPRTDRRSIVVSATVHAWAEGHASAVGHELTTDPDRGEFPVPPYPHRDEPALKAILGRAAEEFGPDEVEGAALYAAGLAWAAGRREGAECLGCVLGSADGEVATAMRRGTGRFRFDVDGPV